MRSSTTLLLAATILMFTHAIRCRQAMLSAAAPTRSAAHHRHLHHRHRRHRPHRRHRHHRRRFHSSKRRRFAARSSAGHSTRRSACAAAQTRAWAAAYIMQHGPRPRLDAGSTVPVYARSASCQSITVVAAVTMRSWCGCGSSVRTRPRRSVALPREATILMCTRATYWLHCTLSAAAPMR